MRNFAKTNRVLIALVCVFLIAACVPIAGRIGVERQNKTYDIVVDYNELVNMADQTHKDVSYWLKQFRDELDIKKVGLAEESIVSLMESTYMPVSGDVMDQITQDPDWESSYPPAFIEGMEKMGFDSFDVVVETGNEEASQFLTNAVKSRFQPEMYFAYEEDGKAYILIDGDSTNALYSQKSKQVDSKGKGFVEKKNIIGSKIMYISLGMLPEKVEEIQKLGMDIVPRTTCYNGFNDTKFAKAVVADYEKYDIVPEYLLASGNGVMGFDDGIDFAKSYIMDNDVTIALIENTTQRQNIIQDGVEEIAQATDFDTVRAFSVWDYIQYRYKYYGYEGAKEIENTLFRAVTERNIRLIYYKPIKAMEDSYTYITDIDEYRTMFSNLEKRLDEHGFSYGSASIMKPVRVSGINKLLIAFGAVAAAVLLLATIFPLKRKHKLAIGGIGVLGVLAAYFVIPNTFELILSFGSAVVFACLAVALYTAAAKSMFDKAGGAGGAEAVKRIPLLRIIAVSAAVLAMGVAISLAGGIMTAAPLSSISYMLEIDIFRGVKLAQLLPLAFFAVIYLAYFGFGEKKTKPGVLEVHDLRDMMNTSVKIWMVLLAGIMGIVGIYYIMRTGHDTGAEVSSAEMLFRNYLEDHLIARPRTKEFMFAFPAVMMMIYTAARRFKLWPVIFGLCGVIGMTSVNNTFMHLRTPLYLGFARTGYSLLFGLVIGVIGILVFELAHKFYVRFIKEYVR